MAHATMGTGAITFPDYETGKMTGYIANHDHVMGAIVVEIENDEIFHFRQIQFDAKGRFVDLGVFVDGADVGKMVPKAMVLGDWHSGETDPTVAKASLDLSKKLGIKEWIMHDTFNGTSISHHNIGKLLLLGKMAERKQLDLTAELNGLVADFRTILKTVQKITIVKSNHDEHLERYLDEGRFMDHPYNIKLSMELASVMLNGQSPIEYYVKKSGINKNIRWLERDESYQIGGVECGAYGDKGANGSRGSAQSLEKAYGNCVYGHAHTPGILRGAWCVGTSTLPYPDYGTGPSSWMNTHCLVYTNGMCQLINCIGGKFSTRV